MQCLMNIKSTVVIFILAFVYANSYSQTIAPVSQMAGKMTIMVDPRVELLCAVQTLTDYPAIARNTLYSKELTGYFGKDTTSEAVRLTSELLNRFGFSYDAPLDLILRLSDAPYLTQVRAFPQRTIERAGGEDNLEKYRLALKQFASDSRFEDFWKSKIPYYQQIVAYTVDSLGEFDPSEVIAHYYNESKKSYNVILSPALGCGYGIRVADRNNELDIYGCLYTEKENNGIPYYDREGLSNFLYHEFSHSYINPLTDLYPSMVDATENLFKPINGKMSYDRWITCLNEHIVRAVHIRILQTTGHEKEALDLLRREHTRSFFYIDPVIDQLKRFEQERDSKNITFTQFYPQLLAVFDSLSHTDNTELIDPMFKGPVQTVLGQTKVVIIYPTNSDDSVSLKNLYDYTVKIQQSKGNGAVLLADTTALKNNLSNDWILAYGTIESNLFLKKYETLFPFRIDGDTIVTDRKQVGEKLRLITCLPNPQNPRRGMLVNTATHNQSLKSVRIPIEADFLVFEDISNIRQNGLYDKNGEWHFGQTPR